jgi:hypothetical protein
VGDVVKGVLGGAWTLLVGWILPSALNMVVLLFAVAPVRRNVPWIHSIWPTTTTGLSLLTVTASVVLGLIISALQNPLYRILEGYLLWPPQAFARGCMRQRTIKDGYADRLALLRLRHVATIRPLAPDEQEQLAALLADSRIARTRVKDELLTVAQRGLMRERLDRYPINDQQILPTRLGNAIRRMEEYGHNRYCLDTQVLWNELAGTVPDQVRRQADLARTSVDFFVALLYGHAVVAVLALLTLPVHHVDHAIPLVAAIALLVLIPVWYRSAVVATDEWTAEVRALVNVGRQPLAAALGLQLPRTLDAERAMWTLVCKMSKLPYDERAARLYTFRKRP